MNKSKVNLFLIGAPKCGTTSLYHALKGTDVFAPRIKELNFFSGEELIERKFGYKDFRLSDLKDYEALFRHSDQYLYRLDGSVSYCSQRSIIKKINSYNSNAKFILLIRHPVERAIAHYKMDLRLGIQGFTLSEILDDLSSPKYFQYIENSRYSRMISDLEEEVGLERVLIIKLENLHDSLTVIEKFLGLTKSMLLPKMNIASHTNSVYHRFIMPNRAFVERLKNIFPGAIVFKHLLSQIKLKKKSFRISESEEQKLYNILKEEVSFYEKIRSNNEQVF